jgi:hypothetical protein
MSSPAWAAGLFEINLFFQNLSVCTKSASPVQQFSQIFNFYLKTKTKMSRDMVPINMRDPFMKDPFFSSTWEEFDKIKHDMMERSKNFWEKVDKDFTNFEDTVKTTHDQMDRQMAPFRPQLPRWAIPEDVKDRWAPMLPQDSQEVSEHNCTVVGNPEGGSLGFWSNSF